MHDGYRSVQPSLMTSSNSITIANPPAVVHVFSSRVAEMMIGGVVSASELVVKFSVVGSVNPA